MPSRRQPRCGSMQYWPRKRASRAYARVRNCPESADNSLLGFIGYKVGMTHMQAIQKIKGTKKSENRFIPVTILECPPIKVAGARFYKKTSYGLEVDTEIWGDVDKTLSRKIVMAKKKPEATFDKIDVEKYVDVRAIVYAQPKLTGIGKKKPELMEMYVGGDIAAKITYIKENLGKEIPVDSIFKEGEGIDIMGVSKGKGFQGTTKRFGTTLRARKSEKNKRGAANVGAWTPKKVLFVQPMPGRMGYHQRTEYNKAIIKIAADPSEINQVGGILSYGNVKNTYVLIKGSVVGPKKRAVVLRKAVRAKKKINNGQVAYLSSMSKQGR